MIRKLRYLRSANDDLIAIGQYIVSQSSSPAVARQFVGRIRNRCKRLASFPALMGTARPELVGGLRSTPSRNYIIYFRYAGDTVEIVNVLHASRDAQAHFTE